MDITKQTERKRNKSSLRAKKRNSNHSFMKILSLIYEEKPLCVTWRIAIEDKTKLVEIIAPNTDYYVITLIR